MLKNISSSNESNVSSAKQVFDHFCGKAHRRFGQNFLFDPKINKKIVDVAGDLSNKVVVEVGPGPGGLTLEILKKNIKKLYLIEIDSCWADAWNSLKDLFPDKLEIIKSDALRFDMKSINPNIIISNLPYNISTQLLFRWLEEFDSYEKLVLMFQKEVADRIYAKPQTKSYGKMSVLCQWKSTATKAFDLDPGSFFPAPKVKSTIVKFDPFDKSMVAHSEKYDLFSSMLTAAFSQRRKIVSKNLSTCLNEATHVLEKFGYGKNARAEEISVADYINILGEISAI